ncbi:MAG TPA: cupin domain-containing protein [Candidatus Xenobia bacterium]|nr:cupin domain-containing protein [Candidatus Xenobia bacterium]
MAVIRIPDEGRVLRGLEAVRSYLAHRGIEYERWTPSHPVPANASEQEILQAYAGEIEQLKQRGGYVAADVVDVTPQTPGLDALLEKFAREHWHDEDEVRFFLHGRALFHIHPRQGPVFALEVEAGDLILLPAGTRHWFNLCADRTMRVIRLFKSPAGWAARYTASGVEQGYQPVCLGPDDLPRPDA